MGKSKARIIQDESRNAIVDRKDGDTSDANYEQEKAIELGAKMYVDKGPKYLNGMDKGPKMTSNPASYRSSMAKHWQGAKASQDMPIIHDEVAQTRK